jgi:Transglutaminase-like superfamily
MLPASARKFMRVSRQLTAPEAAFAARAWLLAPWVELSLATLGLQRTLRAIEGLTPPARRRAPAVTPERARRLVDGIYRLHLVRGRCLPRSLLQYALLRRLGAPVRLVVGVRRGSGLEAHAWVEPITPSPTSEPKDGFERLLVTPRSGFAELDEQGGA